MARIPDFTALGQAPEPRATRPLYDVSAAGTGMGRAAATVQAEADKTGAGLEAFGKGTGQLGLALADAQRRIQEREDAVDRARLIGEFDKTVGDNFRNTLSTQDMSKEETIKGLGELNSKVLEETVSKHRGGPISQAMLRERLIGINSRYGDTIAVKSLAAKEATIKGLWESDLNGAVDVVSRDASQLDAQMQALSSRVDTDLGKVFQPPERDAMKRNALSAMVTGAVRKMLDQGGYNEAFGLLDRADVGPAIGAASVLALKERVREARDQANRDRYSIIAPGGVLLDKTTGKPVYQAPERQHGYFGEGVTGSALDIFTGMTDKFRNGMTTRNEDLAYVTAAQHYAQTGRQVQDPRTGQWMSIPAELPDHVKNALRARGVEAPSFGAAPTGAPTAAPTGAPMGTAPQATAAPETPPARTAWKMGSYVSGPVAAAGTAIARSPGLGALAPFKATTQDQETLKIAQRNLISILQVSRFFTPSEQKLIEEDTSIEPKVWDNETAYRNRLVGIDEALSQREQNALKTLTQGYVPLEEQQRAMRAINAIQQFRVFLGVPPRMKTPEEATNLPSGTEFLDNEGALRRRP